MLAGSRPAMTHEDRADAMTHEDRADARKQT